MEVQTSTYFEFNSKAHRVYYERYLHVVSQCKIIFKKGQFIEKATNMGISKLIELNNAQKI